MLPKYYFREKSYVRTYDVDHNKQMKVPALLNLMHEAAMQNVLQMKVSFWDLEPHNITWVLMRMRLTVHQNPSLGNPIEVLTYPAGFKKLYTYRDYIFFDKNENRVAQASSTWVLMNTQSRRISRIPPFISELEMPEEDYCLPRINDKLSSFGTASFQKTFQVNWHDLDFNKHLGNVTYITWMLDGIPSDWMKKHQLKEIDIQYKLECGLDEKVRVEFEAIENSICRHRIIRESDQKEVALAQTKWESRD